MKSSIFVAMFNTWLILALSLGAFPFLSSATYGQKSEQAILVELREQLPQAFRDSTLGRTLLDRYGKLNPDDPTLLGYIGALHIARSRHAPLLDRMSFLRKGTEILEAAIKRKPNHLELIFLRLTIQVNLPGIMGYKNNIDADKEFVFSNYKEGPPKLQERIVKFVQESKHFSAREKQRVQ